MVAEYAYAPSLFPFSLEPVGISNQLLRSTMIAQPSSTCVGTWQLAGILAMCPRKGKSTVKCQHNEKLSVKSQLN